ncbi:MAG: hypothetical protein AAB443_03195 [Patescibacteria group bacterium]
MFLIVLLLLIFLVGEVLLKLGVEPEFTRKFSHLFAGVVVYFFPYFLSLNSALSIGVLFAVLFFFLEKYAFLKSVTGVSRKTKGSYIMPLALSICAFLYWPRSVTTFQISVILLAFSDTFAFLVGYCVRSPMFIKKSLAGSLSFIVVSTFVYSSFGVMLPFSIFYSFILSVIEASSLNGTDNLFVPIAGGALYFFSLL